jgi:putative ABC transport system permease protein
MMNRMVLANLMYRPFRTIISVVAVAVEVTLILLIVGIMLGMLNDSSSRQVGIGADIMVQPPGSSLIMGVTSAPVSVKVAGKIGQLAHVTAVAPVVMQVTTAGTIEILYGIDLQSFDAVSGGFRYLSGGPFQGPYDMIIDDLKAASKHLKVGDTIETLHHPFRICGIVEHGKGARKFIPIATLQDLNGAIGKASIFYVKLDDANNADAVVAMIKNIPGMQPDDVGQHSRPQHRDRRRDWHCHGDRLHRDLPGDVRRRDGAHPRDWHSEVSGRGQALYRERGATGDAADRDWRGHPGDCA